MDSNFNFKNFSIVIPIYNEEEILEESLNNVLSMCERTNIDFEIILSENGSTDNTKIISSEIVNSNNNVKLIKNCTPNYGEALKRGFFGV